MHVALPAEATPTPDSLSTPRRVVIEALAARFGGTAYATIGLARHLITRPEVDSVTVLARRGSIVERGLTQEEAIRCVALRSASRFELPRRTLWQTTRLPAFIARERFDVLVSMSGMLPRAPSCRVLCLLFNPVMYERSTIANGLRRLVVRRASLRADFVAAPSLAMASLASASIGRECAVVPLGVDHDVFSPAPTAGREMLCVADFYEHKRHDLILEAWALLSAPRPLLRFIGDPAVDPRAYARLIARIQTMPEADSIVVEREISLRGLIDAYRRARVFVMASEQESFCMPVVESMACGVPVIARASASLRETGGAAARYVEGDDPQRWAAAMRDLIDDDVGHERARAQAMKAASAFSWDAMAGALAGHL